MLPLPPVRTVSPPARVRKVVRAVDTYTLWAFNPQHHLVRRYVEPAKHAEDRAA